MPRLRIPITSSFDPDGFKKAGEATRKLGSETRGLGARLRDATIVGFGLVATLKGLAAAAAGPINAAREQQQAETRLATALKNTGQEVSKNLEQLKAWAAQRQRVTTFGDEFTLQLASLGTALGGLSGKDLRDAIEASQDFASATGKDARTAMELLSRAAQGGTADFSRYGLVISKDVAPGMATFRAAIEQIRRSMGGTSEAVAELGTSKLTQLGNSFGDLTEQVGIAATESRGFGAVMGGLKGVIDTATEALARFNQESAKTKAPRLDVQVDQPTRAREPFRDVPGSRGRFAPGFAPRDDIRARIDAGETVPNMFLSKLRDRALFGAGEKLSEIGRTIGRVFSAVPGILDAAGSAVDQLNARIESNLDKIAGLSSTQMDLAGMVPTADAAAMFGLDADLVESGVFDEFFQSMQDRFTQEAANLGMAYVDAFSIAAVEAFDADIGTREAMRRLGETSKDNFIGQFTREALSPVSVAIGEVAKAAASPFKAAIEGIVQGPLSIVTGAIKSVFGALTQQVLNLFGIQTAAAASSATQLAALDAAVTPIATKWAAAAVAASIATLGTATAASAGALTAIAAGKALLAVPGAAEGGLFQTRAGSGGTLAIVAEKEDEIVLPVRKLERMLGQAAAGGGGGGMTVIIENLVASNPSEVADMVNDALQDILRSERIGGRG